MAIYYTDEHERIVESGAEAVREVLFGNDEGEKLSILFCLDYYLDPYYKNKLPYEAEVYRILEELAVTSKNAEAVRSALRLIGDYCCYPVDILKNGIENVIDEMKPYAMYIISSP